MDGPPCRLRIKSATKTRTVWDDRAELLRGKSDKAAGFIVGAKEDGLAFPAFPAAHTKKI